MSANPTHYEIQQIIKSWADERVEDEGYEMNNECILLPPVTPCFCDVLCVLDIYELRKHSYYISYPDPVLSQCVPCDVGDVFQSHLESNMTWSGGQIIQFFGWVTQIRLYNSILWTPTL